MLRSIVGLKYTKIKIKVITAENGLSTVILYGQNLRIRHFNFLLRFYGQKPAHRTFLYNDKNFVSP